MAVASATWVYGVETLRWGDKRRDVPVAYLKGNRKHAYVPFRIMCEVVGVERKRQLGIVRRDYADALEELPLETPAGPREALWMRIGDCALWIGGLSPERTSLGNRENLIAFRDALREAGERLLFDGPRKSPDKRGMFAHSERMEYLFSCLACGAGHRMIAQNGEVTLERYEF